MKERRTTSAEKGRAYLHTSCQQCDHASCNTGMNLQYSKRVRDGWLCDPILCLFYDQLQ